jgi:hypothetical protein
MRTKDVINAITIQTHRRKRWVILFSLAITLLGAGVIYFVFTAPLNPLYSVVFE